MTISEQVVKAMPDRIYAVKRTEGSNCVVSFDTPSLDYNVEYVRADLVPFLPVQGAVKKLEWTKLSTGWIAHTPFHAYEVAQTKNGFMATYANTDFAWGEENAVKAAAQDNYEARFWAMVEASTALSLEDVRRHLVTREIIT